MVISAQRFSLVRTRRHVPRADDTDQMGRKYLESCGHASLAGNHFSASSGLSTALSNRVKSGHAARDGAGLEELDKSTRWGIAG